MKVNLAVSALMGLLVSLSCASGVQAQLVAEIGATLPATQSGGGTDSGYIFNTYWWCQRMESLYTAAELTAAGLYPGAIINAIHFKPTEAPGENLVNIRIRMGHTAATTQAGSFTPSTGLTLVHGPANYSIAQVQANLNNWMVFTLTTPFTWNGTQSLIVDFSEESPSYLSGGGVALRTTTSQRHWRGYQDSGAAFPFDTITNQSGGNTFPQIRLAFPPPQLTVYLNSPPNPRENQPYSAFLTALESPVYLPHSYSITPIQNASWLSVNPSTGELTGTPPTLSAGTVTFSATVTNSKPGTPDNDTDTFTLNIIGVPNIVPEYFDNFNNPALAEQYDIILAPKARAIYSTGAANGAGQGVRLSSNQATGLFTPVDISNAAHRAVLDNPSLWAGGSPVVDPSEFLGTIQLVTRAPGVFDLRLYLDYRIVQTSTLAFGEYHNSMVIEYSEDNGTTWTVARGPSATTASGVYRTPTPTTGPSFVTEVISISGLSGAANQQLRFRVRWICRLMDAAGSVHTYIDIDNLRLEVPFTVTTLGLPSATANVPYAFENGPVTLTQVSGIAPVTWTANPHPAWLNLDPATGVITGMPGPTDVGTTAITFTATDSQLDTASRQINFTVKTAPSAIAITNLPTLPEASEGVPYAYSLSAFGGSPVEFGSSEPRYSWTLTTDPSSAWLSIDPRTGLLIGTPPAGSIGQTASFQVTARDQLYGKPGSTAANTTTKPFFIHVVERLTILTTSFDLAQEGTTFRPVLEAAGGVPPYTWQILSGLLPAGMSFEPSTGRIVGAPEIGTGNNAYPLVIQVSDSGIQSANFSATLVVSPPTTTTGLQITTAALDPTVATETQPYLAFLDATGGVPPYTFVVAPGSPDQLPSGLTISAEGVISGSPFSGMARRYFIVIEVSDATTDAFGNGTPQAAIASFDLDVESLISPPSIITTELQIGEVGLAYPPVLPFAPTHINAPGLRVAGGSAPFEWELVSGTLPEGIVMSSIGLLVGVPLVGAELQSPYPLTIRVTDANNLTDTVTLDLVVNAFSGAPLSIIATTIPAAVEGAPFSFRLSATGGANPTQSTLPYTYRRITGTLPIGLEFDVFGQLRGSPAAGSAAEYNITFEVRDSAGHTAQREMLLSVVNVDGGGLGLNAPGTTNPVELSGSGSGCSVTRSGGSGGYAWLLILGASAVALGVRRRRA